jgi:hypothetical protein
MLPLLKKPDLGPAAAVGAAVILPVLLESGTCDPACLLTAVRHHQNQSGGINDLRAVSLIEPQIIHPKRIIKDPGSVQLQCMEFQLRPGSSGVVMILQVLQKLLIECLLPRPINGILDHPNPLRPLDITELALNTGSVAIDPIPAFS